MSDLEKIPSTTESIDQTQKAQAIPPENFEPNQNQEENKQANDSFISLSLLPNFLPIFFLMLSTLV